MSTRVISFRPFLFVLLSCLLLLTACGSVTETTATVTPTVTATNVAVDAFGTPIVIPEQAPQRIISLAASTTEILGALQLREKVIAVDLYSNYPLEFADLPKVSSANGYNAEQIISLKPDLVLSAGGFSKSIQSQLIEADINLVDLPHASLDKTLEQIILVGRITHTEPIALQLTEQMQLQLDEIEKKVEGTTAPSVLLEADYSMPGKPFVYGGGSFGDELLEKANGVNIFHDNTTNDGFPQVTDEAIIAKNPQFIILTSLPDYGGDPELVYQRANWQTIEAVKQKQVYYINSNIMQRPGPRLPQALRCLAQVLHPNVFTESLPAYCTETV